MIDFIGIVVDVDLVSYYDFIVIVVENKVVGDFIVKVIINHDVV